MLNLVVHKMCWQALKGLVYIEIVFVLRTKKKPMKLIINVPSQ